MHLNTVVTLKLNSVYVEFLVVHVNMRQGFLDLSNAPQLSLHLAQSTLDKDTVSGFNSRPFHLSVFKRKNKNTPLKYMAVFPSLLFVFFSRSGVLKVYIQRSKSEFSSVAKVRTGKTGYYKMCLKKTYITCITNKHYFFLNKVPFAFKIRAERLIAFAIISRYEKNAISQPQRLRLYCHVKRESNVRRSYDIEVRREKA